MIKRITDREKILPLWQEAFGDTEEEIHFFLDFAKNIKCICSFEGEEPAALLFLVDCRIREQKLHYIYAACTAKKYRNEGVMTELLKFCEANYQPLCLIPARDALAEYYAERGFTEKAGIEELQFDEIEDIKEYLLEGYSLSEPTVLINKGVK